MWWFVCIVAFIVLSPWIFQGLLLMGVIVAYGYAFLTDKAKSFLEPAKDESTLSGYQRKRRAR